MTEVRGDAAMVTPSKATHDDELGRRFRSLHGKVTTAKPPSGDSGGKCKPTGETDD